MNGMSNYTALSLSENVKNIYFLSLLLANYVFVYIDPSAGFYIFLLVLVGSSLRDFASNHVVNIIYPPDFDEAYDGNQHGDVPV